MAKPQENSTKDELIASISVRHVKKQTWTDFKKLAMIHELSLQEYLDKIVAEEMKRVQINFKRK